MVSLVQYVVGRRQIDACDADLDTDLNKNAFRAREEHTGLSSPNEDPILVVDTHYQVAPAHPSGTSTPCHEILRLERST